MNKYSICYLSVQLRRKSTFVSNSWLLYSSMSKVLCARLVWLARISFAHAFVGHFVMGSDCKAFVFDTLSCVQYLHG